MKFATELFSVIRDSLHTVTAILELQTEERGTCTIIAFGA